MTDEALSDRKVGRDFAKHDTENHGAKEYARGNVTNITKVSSSPS